MISGCTSDDGQGHAMSSMLPHILRLYAQRGANHVCHAGINARATPPALARTSMLTLMLTHKYWLYGCDIARPTLLVRAYASTWVAQGAYSAHAVTSMLGYLAIRSSAPGPLFQYADGSPLSRTRLVTQLREALS